MKERKKEGREGERERQREKGKERKKDKKFKPKQFKNLFDFCDLKAMWKQLTTMTGLQSFLQVKTVIN